MGTRRKKSFGWRSDRSARVPREIPDASPTAIRRAPRHRGDTRRYPGRDPPHDERRARGARAAASRSRPKEGRVDATGEASTRTDPEGACRDRRRPRRCGANRMPRAPCRSTRARHQRCDGAIVRGCDGTLGWRRRIRHRRTSAPVAPGTIAPRTASHLAPSHRRTVLVPDTSSPPPPRRWRATRLGRHSGGWLPRARIRLPLPTGALRGPGPTRPNGRGHRRSQCNRALPARHGKSPGPDRRRAAVRGHDRTIPAAA